MAATQSSSIVGCLLGTAVGDALGLPYEGLSSRRGVRLVGEPDRYRFVLGRGMVSDDTEHTCLVAQALIASAGEPDEFGRQLARRLRWWFLGLPAGIGFATLRAILKLWMFVPLARQGVFSAGNGPAMRSAILGAAIDDPVRLRALVHRATVVTHTDPKAEQGALAVALAARHARTHPRIDPDRYLRDLESLLERDEAGELLRLVAGAVEHAKTGEPTTAYAASIGLGRGVSGYVLHTVPVAIHAWISCGGDLRRALVEVVRCGGDTDSVGAIVGGIVGAGGGREAIPDDLLRSLAEWPRSVLWMERLGLQLGRVLKEGRTERPSGLPVLGIAVRNLTFLVLVLLHGLRRLLPPY
ncbi:MAG TPA: ADP-ribosylglycohydrolase family protein [Thermoanaerobaculia bacterium]|nr:ADP-ribosylglycohydrolase family protein [Thermoanaerobaculia bacterium]